MPVVFYFAAFAGLATVAILVIGIVGFGSGRASPAFSNRMMRLRIIGQFIAVILILATVLVIQAGD